MSELPSSEDLDPSTGTDAPTPPTTTGPSSYTLNWEEPDIADLCGHSGTSITESVYRHQLRPVLLNGAVAMDRTFGPDDTHGS